MNGIVDVYEKYFADLTSFQFDFHKRKQHTCLICTSKITDGCYGIFCRKLTEKFVIDYFEHLKVFNYCVILSNIFIESVRENGILSSKVKGYWQIKKHTNHEVVIIEHTSKFIKIGEKLISKEDQKRVNFFKKLLREEEKGEKEEKIVPKLEEEFLENEGEFLNLENQFEKYPAKLSSEDE